MNYYEVRYILYNAKNQSIGKYSLPIAAKDKKTAYAKAGDKINAPHSILYASEISYSLFTEWNA